MNPTHTRRQRVEDACAALITAGKPVTFDTVAAHADVSRATLYRHPDLRAVVEEHRLRTRQAHTLSDIETQIAHLRTALEAIADKVRRHEEQLRRLTTPIRN
jgi:AcrR family transcriptional regulator